MAKVNSNQFSVIQAGQVLTAAHLIQDREALKEANNDNQNQLYRIFFGEDNNQVYDTKALLDAVVSPSDLQFAVVLTDEEQSNKCTLYQYQVTAGDWVLISSDFSLSGLVNGGLIVENTLKLNGASLFKSTDGGSIPNSDLLIPSTAVVFRELEKKLNLNGGTLTGDITTKNIIVDAVKHLLATTIIMRDSGKIQIEDEEFKYIEAMANYGFGIYSDEGFLVEAGGIELTGFGIIELLSQNTISIKVGAPGSENEFLLKADGTFTYNGYNIITEENLPEIGFPTTPVNYIQFATNWSVEPTFAQGKWFWDKTKGQPAYFVRNPNTQVNPGFEQVVPVVNKSGSQKLNGKVVYPVGYSDDLDGIKGFEIQLADNRFKDKSDPIAVLTQTLDDTISGNATTFGLADSIDLLSLGFTTVGEKAYLGLNGNLTPTRPTKGSYVVVVGFVAEIGTPGNDDGVLQVDISRSELTPEVTDTNGFPIEQRFNFTITIDELTRTLHLTKLSDYHYYQDGIKYEETTNLSKVFTDDEGPHAVYFDNGELQILPTPTKAEYYDIILSKAYVSVFYWDSTNQRREYITDERHGISMSPATHLWGHQTRKTAYLSGMSPAIINIDEPLPISDNTPLEYSISSGENVDEDLEHTLTEKLVTGAIREYYFEGANKNLRRNSENQYGISAGVNSRLNYNLIRGGVGSIVEAVDNRYVFRAIVAVADVDKTRTNYFAFMGTNSYTSIANAEAGAPNELSTLLTNLSNILEEFTIVAFILYHTRDLYLNTYKSIIVSVSDGDFIDYRSEQISGVGGLVNNHNDLAGRNDPDQHITEAITDNHTRNYTLAGDTQKEVNDKLDTKLKEHSDTLTRIDELTEALEEKTFLCDGAFETDKDGNAVLLPNNSTPVVPSKFPGATLSQLLDNGDLSQGTTLWSPTRATHAVINERLEVTDNNENGEHYSQQAPNIALSIGRKHMMIGDIEVPSANTKAGAALVLFNRKSDGNYESQSSIVVGIGETKRVSVFLTPTSNYSTPSIVARLRMYDVAGASPNYIGVGDKAYFDNVMVIDVQGYIDAGMTETQIISLFQEANYMKKGLHSLGEAITTYQEVDKTNEFGNATTNAGTVIYDQNNVPYLEIEADGTLNSVILPNNWEDNTQYTVLTHAFENSLIGGTGLFLSNTQNGASGNLDLQRSGDNKASIFKKLFTTGTVVSDFAQFAVSSTVTSGKLKFNFAILKGDWTWLTDEQALQIIKYQEFGAFDIQYINIRSTDKNKLDISSAFATRRTDSLVPTGNVSIRRIDNTIEFTNDTTFDGIGFNVNVLPEKDYYLSVLSTTANRGGIYFYDSNGNEISNLTAVVANYTFTTPVNTAYIRVVFASSVVGTWEVVEPQVVPGTTAPTEYNTFNQNVYTLIPDTIYGLGSVPTGVYDDEKTQRTKAELLIGANVSLRAGGTNVEAYQISIPKRKLTITKNFLIEGFNTITSPPDFDLPELVYSAYGSASDDFIRLLFPNGTDLATAQAFVDGLLSRYELATPLERSAENNNEITEYGGITTSKEGTFEYLTPNGVKGEFTIKLGDSIDAVVKMNSNAIKYNTDKLVEHQKNIDLLFDSIDPLKDKILYITNSPSNHTASDVYSFIQDLDSIVEQKIEIWFYDTVRNKTLKSDGIFNPTGIVEKISRGTNSLKENIYINGTITLSNITLEEAYLSQINNAAVSVIATNTIQIYAIIKKGNFNL